MTNAGRQENEIKGTKGQERNKNFLSFADDMIVENSQILTNFWNK